MTVEDDGGPAFPNNGGSDSALYASYGMTLRDWFAGQALVNMGMWVPNDSDYPTTQVARAKWAYAQADAMLAAREGEPNGTGNV